MYNMYDMYIEYFAMRNMPDFAGGWEAKSFAYFISSLIKDTTDYNMDICTYMKSI